MKLKEEFYQFGLERLNYRSKKDLYENLYLRSTVDTYRRINKSAALENEIRDRFILDLERKNQLTRDLIQNDILQLDFERQHFVSPSEKRRTDIVFFITGFGKFTVECKRLFKEPSRNEEYINEGLKRFVELKYSENEAYAGMIGFVVSGNIRTITEDVSTKVVTEVITRSGDLWLLGEHRILCGDATKKEDADRLMDGRRNTIVM